MAKKVKTDKKKEIKKVEEIEEDVLDFEEYDDEDETVVELPRKSEKEKKVVKKENDSDREGCPFQYKEYLPIATFIISVITLILIIAILGKVSDGTTTKKSTSGSENEGTETAEYDTSMFTEIDADKFVELVKNKKEYYFVYTGRPSCSYCQMMIGNYQQSVEEYDYELYYYDTENVTSEIVSEIQGLDEIFEQDFPSTPMVYLVGKGEVKDVNEGYTEYSTYANFLEDNGVEKK